MFGKPPQPLEERGHLQVAEIGELQLGFVTVQLLFDYGLKAPVVPKHATTDHNNMPGARFELQRRLEGLCCVDRSPRPRKTGVELQVV